MSDKKILLYMHAGSGNHGCEAIVSSLADILDRKDMTLLSYRAEEDEKYSLSSKCKIYNERSFDKHKIAHVLYYAYRKITHDYESLIRYRYDGFISPQKTDLAISIGGDNYCYDSMLGDLKLSNRAFKKAGIDTVLLGCSIEPELMDRNDIIEDLDNYSKIITRESITYSALKEALKRNAKDSSKVYLLPDPAFALKTELIKDDELPKGFAKDNTVGINISPMIQSNEKTEGITLSNYRKMITWILYNTEMNIALIPHVVWNNNDDRVPCNMLFDEFSAKYPDRIAKVEDADASTIKGYISKLRFFIGARTHSTIAAYSSLVPTLVVGYSVKAKGIAKDLFGTYDNYVIPVQSLEKEDDLLKAAKWMFDNESKIKESLSLKIPMILAKMSKYSEIL